MRLTVKTGIKSGKAVIEVISSFTESLITPQ